MKKKMFYQTNIFWQLLCFVFFALFITILVVLICEIVDLVNRVINSNPPTLISIILRIGVLLLGTIFSLIAFIMLERNNIYLDNEKIYMKDQGKSENDKIQYYSEARFDQIESIDILWTNRDSRGKRIKSIQVSSLVEKSYLSIKTFNGEVNNFLILYMTKKTVLKLLKEIELRMRNNGNPPKNIDIETLVNKLNRRWVVNYHD